MWVRENREPIKEHLSVDEIISLANTVRNS